MSSVSSTIASGASGTVAGFCAGAANGCAVGAGVGAGSLAVIGGPLGETRGMWKAAMTHDRPEPKSVYQGKSAALCK